MIERIKLENILLKMANDVLDLVKTNDPIGKPIDDAADAILELFNGDGNEDKDLSHD